MNNSRYFKEADLVEDTFGIQGRVAKINDLHNRVWVWVGNGQMCYEPRELKLIHREGMEDGPELLELED
jgi:hypothetical protein